VVIARREGFEETDGGPTASNDDQFWFVGEVAHVVVLLVADLGGDDGEVPETAELGLEGEGVEGDAVDVLFRVGEGVVDEDASADEEDAEC
jgi:hypothetical protein